MFSVKLAILLGTAALVFLICFILNEAGKNVRAHNLARYITSWLGGARFTIMQTGLSHYQIIIFLKVDIEPAYRRLNSSKLDCLEYHLQNKRYGENPDISGIWPYPIFISYSGDIFDYDDDTEYYCPDDKAFSRIIYRYSLFTPSTDDEKEFLFHSMNLSTLEGLIVLSDGAVNYSSNVFEYPAADTFQRKSIKACAIIDI